MLPNQVSQGGPTARLVETDEGLVADSDTIVTDDVVLELIDSGRIYARHA